MAGRRFMMPLVCLAMLANAGPALAGDQVTTVLGLLSGEAESSFAEELSGYLREALDAREALGHSGKDQTLEQVAMAFGCLESLDPMCLQEIGEGLETTTLVYGRVEIKGEGEDAAYKATITLFDVVEGKVEKTTAVQIPLDQQGTIYLQEASDRIIATLFGEKQRTTLIVQSNVSGATIKLDGEQVGETGSEPLWLRDLEPGEHELVIEKDGYEAFEKDFEIEEGGRLDIDAPMFKVGEKPPVTGGVGEGGGVGPVGPAPKKKDKNKVKLIAGIGVGVLGLAMIGTGGGMTAMVAQANDDLAEARSLTLSGKDVCACFDASTPSSDCFGSPAWPTGVSQSSIKDACSKGKAGQAAQFVFYGLGAAAAGVGIYLIIDSVLKSKKEKHSSDDAIELEQGGGQEEGDEEFEEEETEDEEEEEEARLQVMPFLSPDGGFITATVHF